MKQLAPICHQTLKQLLILVAFGGVITALIPNHPRKLSVMQRIDHGVVIQVFGSHATAVILAAHPIGNVGIPLRRANNADGHSLWRKRGAQHGSGHKRHRGIIQITVIGTADLCPLSVFHALTRSGRSGDAHGKISHIAIHGVIHVRLGVIGIPEFPPHVGLPARQVHVADQHVGQHEGLVLQKADRDLGGGGVRLHGGKGKGKSARLIGNGVIPCAVKIHTQQNVCRRTPLDNDGLASLDHHVRFEGIAKGNGRPLQVWLVFTRHGFKICSIASSRILSNNGYHVLFAVLQTLFRLVMRHVHFGAFHLRSCGVLDRHGKGEIPLFHPIKGRINNRFPIDCSLYLNFLAVHRFHLVFRFTSPHREGERKNQKQYKKKNGFFHGFTSSP